MFWLVNCIVKPDLLEYNKLLKLTTDQPMTYQIWRYNCTIWIVKPDLSEFNKLLTFNNWLIDQDVYRTGPGSLCPLKSSPILYLNEKQNMNGEMDLITRLFA